MPDIYISSRSFNRNPIIVNGKSHTVPTDRLFNAPDDLIEALTNANIPFSLMNLQDSEQKVFVVRGARVGVDAYGLITAAVSAAKAAGGGRVVLPPINGPYSISETIRVDVSNIIIELQGDVLFTKTIANDSSLHCVFRFQSQTFGEIIENVGLFAPRKVKIDANARGVLGWVQVTGKVHHAVYFSSTRNAFTHKIYAYNGLVGGITAVTSPGFLCVRCDASDTVQDNGITIYGNNEAIIPYSDSDPNSWTRAAVLHCRAWNCANHGIDTFGAVDVYLDDLEITNCGNNTGTGISGPAGGLGFEYNNIPANIDRDHRILAVNVRIIGSWGFGIRTNCKGTTVIGGYVRGTKIPTAVGYQALPEYAALDWGNGIFIQYGAIDARIEVDVSDSERWGAKLRGIAADSFPSPGLDYRGKMSGNVAGGIWASLHRRLSVSADSQMIGNGSAAYTTTANDNYTVRINNNNAGHSTHYASYNRIPCTFQDNYGGMVSTQAAGTLDIRGMSGDNNGRAWAAAYHQTLLNCARLMASNMMVTNRNGKTARIIQGSAAKAIVDRRSVLGEQTSANPFVDIPKITYSALQITTQTGSGNFTLASAPAGGTFFPGMTIVAAGIPAGAAVGGLVSGTENTIGAVYSLAEGAVATASATVAAAGNTVFIGDLIEALGGVAPATVPNYVNQDLTDTTGGKFYRAKGSGSAADWIPLN